MQKVKKIIVREVRYFFFALFLIGSGALPFLTDHFSKEPTTTAAQNLSNENISILNDRKLNIESAQLSQLSFFKKEWKNKGNEDRQSMHLYFMYFAYVCLVIFFIYPVRYNIYILNYLLEQ
ncbi:hypothetical protein [Flammeovirga sp. OC4]|uniref:hypothetical protein n=1 Tax=Flammeovirga sp. OC4 TaxID=1382345 RepID=UPI0012E01C4E|nr:hypothetical protein [Flammeovirga sp. OC4]